MPVPLEAAPAREPASIAPAPARRAHVCFVAPTTWPVISGDTAIKVVGGAEVQQSMIAPALARRGHRVSMICLDYGQPDGTVVDGVAIRNLHKPEAGVPGLRFVHPRFTALWRAMKAVDADVYYQRTAAVHTAYMAAFSALHGKKSIYAGASDVDFLPGQEDIRFTRDKKIFAWGVRHVDRIVTQNEVQQAQLFDHYGIEGSVIPSCYLPPVGSGNDPRGYVLWTASIRPSKRAELALEIARRLPRQRFVVIGGPDPDRKSQEYFASLQEAARTLPNVEMRGFVPFTQAEQWFNGARVVLNTSLYEGFPNTFLQAWSRAIPTVAFIDTGSRGPDGAPVYDTAGDVAEASGMIERLMADDAHWSRASRCVAAHFRASHSVDAVIDRYEREIAHLVGHR
ncbi:MAG TPA: glycosyltransferase family 4 protein [Usitatibacter sp.]|nr:glycosyltransferase family 4 protein [Usitatibacter sp.]